MSNVMRMAEQDHAQSGCKGKYASREEMDSLGDSVLVLSGAGSGRRCAHVCDRAVRIRVRGGEGCMCSVCRARWGAMS